MSGSTVNSRQGSPSELPEGRFSGPADFSAVVRLALAAAVAQGWREVIVSDQDFHDWPLGERTVVESLNDWARSGRQFTMIAASFDDMHRRHARFVTWRKTWSHVVNCRLVGKSRISDVPSALWSPEWIFHRLDPVRMTGFSGSEAVRRVVLQERLTALVLKSSPGFPATTLGL